MLLVKKSTIPKAGKGLFTTEELPKGTRIIEYEGEVIPWSECERRAEEDKGGYVFFINSRRCIDAYFTRDKIARYANDAAGVVRRKGVRNNSVYEIIGKRVFIVSTRRIRAGEEIFVSYGRDYWKVIAPEMFKKKKKTKTVLAKKKKKSTGKKSSSRTRKKTRAGSTRKK